MLYIGPINALLLFKQRKLFIPGVRGAKSMWTSRDSEPVSYWCGFALSFALFPVMASWFVVMNLNFFFGTHITIFSNVNALIFRH